MWRSVSWMYVSTLEHCSFHCQLQVQQSAHHMHLSQDPSASSEQWMERKQLHHHKVAYVTKTGNWYCCCKQSMFTGLIDCLRALHPKESIPRELN